MLIEEYRGDVLENTHDGRICVVDKTGRVVGGTGDINALTYFRSASKPFQTLPLIMRGVDEKFGLTDTELTVCAGSHAGEDIHIAALESILKKTGLKEEQLIMLPEVPAHEEFFNRHIREGRAKRKLNHNCAGKHIALMMLQRELCGSAENYWQLQSPAQQEVLNAIAAVSDVGADTVKCGTDGCGVPVFAVPLSGIATAYLKLAQPNTVNDPHLSSALFRISQCIAKNPYMMRGNGYLCGEINTLPNIAAKGGAEGVYGIGLKKEGLGISLKIADGSEQTWPIIITEILRQLDYKDDEAFALLNKMMKTAKINHNGTEVGCYRPVFMLR